MQDVITVPASPAGLPALPVPVRRSVRVDGGTAHDNQWPIGISVVNQWGTDDMILAIGESL